MKNNVIKINNKIAANSTTSTNSNEILNCSNSSNVLKDFNVIIANESEFKAQDDKFLITNSCNNFSNLPSPSLTLKSENKSENDLTQVKKNFKAMKLDESDTKLEVKMLTIYFNNCLLIMLLNNF